MDDVEPSIPKNRTLCVLSILCAAAMARSTFAEDYPQGLVGKVAPILQLESVLANGKPINLTPKFVGAVTLVDFWFINCGPCRHSVPHLNKLVKEFVPKGLQTYAVTFDNTSSVQKFLGEIPIAATIGIDTSRATMKAYQVTAYPTTFLVGKSGKVLACGAPDSFTDQVISDALAGKPIKLKPTAAEAPVAEAPISSAPAVAGVRFTSAASVKSSSYQITNEKVSFKGVGLRQAIQYLYNLRPNECEMNLQPDERIFDLEVEMPGAKRGEVLELMKASLERAFRLEIKEEKRDQNVAVFRKNGPLKGVTPYVSGPRGATGDKFTGSSLASIVDSVAYMMGTIGINETGDKGLYDFTFNLDEKKSLIDQVKEVFGLDVTMEMRPMPFTVVRQRAAG